MIEGFDHTGIFVDDIRRSLEFYRRCLHAEVIREIDLPEKQLSMAYIRIGTGVIELIEKRTSGLRGFDHVAFKVRGIRTEWDELAKSAGVDPVVPPKRAVSGVGEIAFLLDPNRTRIELIDRPEPGSTPPAIGPAGDGIGLSFVTLTSANIQSTRRWFTGHLGAETMATPEVAEGNLGGCFIRSGEGVILLSEIPDVTVQGRPGIDHVAVVANDIERLAALVREYPDVRVIPDGAGRIGGSGRFAVFGPDSVKFVCYERSP